MNENQTDFWNHLNEAKIMSVVYIGSQLKK